LLEKRIFPSAALVLVSMGLIAPVGDSLANAGFCQQTFNTTWTNEDGSHETRYSQTCYGSFNTDEGTICVISTYGYWEHNEENLEEWRSCVGVDVSP
jgi:hypothetical protein